MAKTVDLGYIKGPQGPQGPKGDTGSAGATGPQGPKGDTGPADLLKIYPIGAIYMSTSSASPASLFGGTWTSISGYFLYATTSNVGSTGGSNDAVVVANSHTASTSSAGSHSHTASTSSAGSHTHNLHKRNSGSANGVWSLETQNSINYNLGSGFIDAAGAHTHTVTVNNNGSHTHTVTVNSTGSSASGANMPAYYRVYCWRRTQ